MFRSKFVWILVLALLNFGRGWAQPEHSALHDVVFIKLGGSIVTHTDEPYSARTSTISQFAEELSRVMKARPDIKIIIGHGSGSFGHTAAKEQNFDKRKGFPSVQSAAIVAKAALDLHAIIISELIHAGIPAFSMPPSATGMMDYNSKRLVSMDVLQIQRILEMGGVPVVFGDVIPFSNGEGTSIATTEEIFAFLAKHFNPSTIFLLGEILAGEIDEIRHQYLIHRATRSGSQIPTITPETWTQVLASRAGTSSNPVTQDMVKRVDLMMDVVKRNPRIKVYMSSGITKDVLKDLLVDHIQQPTCTLIQASEKRQAR